MDEVNQDNSHPLPRLRIPAFPAASSFERSSRRAFRVLVRLAPPRAQVGLPPAAACQRRSGVA